MDGILRGGKLGSADGILRGARLRVGAVQQGRRVDGCHASGSGRGLHGSRCSSREKVIKRYGVKVAQ